MALTEQRQAEQVAAETSYTHLFALLEKEKKDHADAEARINDSNNALLAERDGLRKQLYALQVHLRASAPAERDGRGEELVGHLGRCADLAAQCAAELRRKEQALRTCVRAYEDVRLIGGGR